jgi:hypothetical protein
MFEVKLDEKLNKHIVAPVSAAKSDDYFIVCASEYDAKSLCAQITMGMIPEPVDNPLKYSSVGTHPNGITRLYRIKS